MRKTGRVVAIVAVVIGLIVAISQDPATIRLDSVMPAEDDRFVEYVAALTASPSTSDDRYATVRFRRCWTRSARPRAASI